MNKFSISEALSFGWETFKNNVSFFIILVVILAVVQFAGQLVSGMFEDSPSIALLISLIFFVVNLLVSIGGIKITLDFVDGKRGDFKDLYAHSSLLLKMIGTSILQTIIVLVGFILLIIPGIYLSIKLSFASYVVVDKKAGPIDAIKTSYEITKGNWWNLAFLGLLSGLIIIAGALAFIVGLFAAIPVVMIAYAYAYRKLSGNSGMEAAPVSPAPEPEPAAAPAAGVITQS